LSNPVTVHPSCVQVVETESPDGDVGLPPQADNQVPATTTVAALQAFAQNSRRL